MTGRQIKRNTCFICDRKQQEKFIGYCMLCGKCICHDCIDKHYEPTSWMCEQL